MGKYNGTERDNLTTVKPRLYREKKRLKEAKRAANEGERAGELTMEPD